MTRAELQRLARDRIRDAKALLAARRWSAAYYLAGYAIECALKSCIIVYLMKTDQFPARRFSERCWTHNLVDLIELAGLKTEFDADQRADPLLQANWNIVRDWNESTRYERIRKANARRFFAAIIDRKHGVLSWFRSRW